MFLLINLPSRDTRKNTYPLGLAYIAESMRNYGSVEVMDLHYDPKLETELYRKLISGQYIFIGFTVCSTHMTEAIRVARIAKELSPGIIVGIGGPHPTYSGKQILKEHIEFDIAFVGAGEKAAARLAENLSQKKPWYDKLVDCYWKDGRNIIHTGEYAGYDKDFIKKPARDLLPSPEEYADKLGEVPTLSIDTSRGCPGQCSFCTFSINRERRWACRNIEDVLSDIKEGVSNNKTTTLDLFFIDADFLASPKRAEKLLQGIIALDGIGKFVIASRADSILKAEAILDLLFTAGCTAIEIGIEASAQSQLDRYNKRTTSVENEKAIQLLQTYKRKYKFAITADMIPFEPFGTYEELCELNTFYQKYFYGDIQNEVSFVHKMMLSPGSLYRDKAILEGKALPGNSDDLPEWKFQDQDCARVYAELKYYIMMIYEKKCKVRNDLLTAYKKDQLNKKQIINYYNEHRWIDTITYDIINQCINTKGNMDILKQVDDISAHLNRISEMLEGGEDNGV